MYMSMIDSVGQDGEEKKLFRKVCLFNGVHFCLTLSIYVRIIYAFYQ